MAKLYDGQILEFLIKFYGDYKGYILWIIGLGIFIIAMLYHAVFLMTEKFSFQAYKIHIILLMGSLTVIIGLIYAIQNRKPILIFTENGLLYKNLSNRKIKEIDITWEEIDKIEINYGKYCIKGAMTITLKNQPILTESVTLWF